jgi:hypothetical protein
MATASAFLHLKCLLTGIESTSQRLKANIIDEKSSKPFVGTEGDEYVIGLEKKVQDVQLRLDTMEASVCGAIEIRLSQVTMVEILQKCKTLHIANEEMIMAAEKRMVAYGYSPPINSTDFLPADNGEKTLDYSTKIAAIVNYNAIEIRPQSIDAESILDPTSSPKNNQKASAFIDCEEEVHHTLREAQYSDESSNENCQFDSPAPNKISQSENSEIEVKTPALPDWKLSQATRMLVLKGETKENLNKSVMPTTYLSTPSASNTHPGKFDDIAPQTPGAPDLSHPSIAQTNHAPLGVFESEMLTPKQITGISYKMQTPLPCGDSPATPNFGTPFHTTLLRNVTTTAAAYPSVYIEPDIKVNLAESMSMTAGSENPLEDIEATPFKEPSSTVSTAYLGIDSPTMTTPCLLRYDGDSKPVHTIYYEDSALQPSTLQLSPPKIAIMAPMSAGTLSERRLPAITEVTGEEWDSAPAFLRKQVGYRAVVSADLPVYCVSSKKKFFSRYRQQISTQQWKESINLF